MIFFRSIYFFLFIFSFNLFAEELNTEEIIVYSNKFYTTEQNSAHHAEIYNQKEIEKLSIFFPVLKEWFF